MPPKNPLLLYLRSRLSISLSIAGAALIVLAAAFLRGAAFVPILLIIVVWAVLTALLFFSRRGAQEIVREKEEDQLAGVRARITHVAEVRERISVLRLADEQVSRAIEYFLQESGQYIEKCRQLSRYSPLANDRIDRVLEICQVFLGERDEEATGRRYGVPGSHEAPAQEEAGRFASDIMECARVIRERTVEDLLDGGLAQHLAIEKELEEDK